MAIESGTLRRLARPGFMMVALTLGAVAFAGSSPNVLLIIADDYGWADVSANNEECFYETPALDALAASGANFVHGYAASPVCSPTRASIMSGRYPSRGHMTEWFSAGPARSMSYLSADRASALPNQAVTIAEHLRAAGYQTFFAGKWHLGDADRHLPTFQGFDVNIAGSGRGNPGQDGFFAPYQPFIGLDAPEGEHLPARLTDETISYLEARDTDRPFLAVLSYYSVHTPLQGRDDLVEKYEARRDALGLTDAQRFGDEEQVWPDRGDVRPVRVRQDHAVYAAMVEAMDEHIGRLLGAVDRLGLRNDTVVIFVSDNGGLSTAEGSPTANLPLRGGKGWLYEGGIRVPMIARWPGVLDNGRAIKAPAITNDILPTVLDAAGIAMPQTDGVSFRDLAVNTGADRPLFFHYPHYGNQGGFPGGAMIDWPWKLIQRYEDGRVHLYDLDADVGESTDLAETMPERVAEMRARFESWLESQDARFLNARPGEAEPWRPGYLREPMPNN